MATETELKLVASPHVLREAARAPWIRAMRSGPLKKEKLVSVYFDTPDRTLQKNNAALRIRRQSGKRVQTIKTEDDGPGALSRGEWEQPIAGNRPDFKAVGDTPLASLLKGNARKAVRPIFETAVERTTMPLCAGTSEVELAIDNGFIRAGKRRQGLHEFELELKRGDPRDLATLAEKCADAWSVSFGALSKAERGYALSNGAAGHAVSTREIRLVADQSVGSAFTKIGLSCLHHLAGNEAAVQNEDSEGVHQMRVGIRRLRAAMSVFKDVVQDENAETIKKELKWLTEQLGPARDLDVLVQDALNPLQKEEMKRREIETLKSDAEERRDEGFAKAKAAVKSTRYRKLVLDTALWLIAGAWSRSKDPLSHAALARRVGDFAPEALHKRLKKVVKKSQKAEELDAQGRHKLRINVKKARYSTEFFAGLFEKRKEIKTRERFEKHLKALQDSLGKLNDIAVHDRLAGEIVHLGKCTKNDLQKAYAMGLLSGGEHKMAADCIAETRKAGRKLADAKTFWR